MNLITHSNAFSATMVVSGFVICGLAAKNAGLVAIGACSKIGALGADLFNNETLAQDLRSNGNRFINLAKQNIGAELKIATALAVAGIASMIAKNQLNAFQNPHSESNVKENLNNSDSTNLNPLNNSESKVKGNFSFNKDSNLNNSEIYNNSDSTNLNPLFYPEFQGENLSSHFKIDHFPGVTDLNLYESLEQKMTHTSFDESMLKPYLDRLGQFPENRLFRLTRLVLIKNDSPELYQLLFDTVKDQLSINSKKILQTIQSKLAQIKTQNEEIKQQILQSFKAPKIKANNKIEEEKRIKELILPHAEKLLELYEEHGRLGQFSRRDNKVNYFDGGETIVLELKALPGIIFKFSPKEGKIAAKYDHMGKVSEACEQHSLKHLRLPHSVVIEELNGKPVKFLAEEKLDILLSNTFNERLQMMNSDPELLPIANEFLRQLTVLIIETGLGDICSDNIGFLKDGSGLGILDVDHLDYSTEYAIYTSHPRNLLSSVYPPNFEILQKTLIENNKKGIDFQKHESNRLKQCDVLEKQRRLWAKNGVLEASDPIDFDHRLLAELTSQDQLRAITMVDVLNEALLTGNTLGRRINYQLDKLLSLDPWKGKNYIEKRVEISKFLIDKEIIIGPDSCRGITVWVTC